MTFKKLCSAILAAAMVLTLGLSASAATSYLPRAGSFVDEDGRLVDRDTFSPGGTYYYVIGNTADYGILTDKNSISFSLKKTSNGKYITDAALLEKRFGNDRMVCIRFEVKDILTDDEYKVQMEANFRARVDLDIQNRADVAAGRAFPKFAPKTSHTATFTANSSTITNYNSAADTLEKVKQEIDAQNASLMSLATLLGETAPYTPNLAKAAAAEQAFKDAVANVQALTIQVNQQAESVRMLEQNPTSGLISSEKITELTNKKNTLAVQIENIQTQLRALGIIPGTYLTSTDPLDAQKLLPYYNSAVANQQVMDSGASMPQSFTNWNTFRANYLLSYPADAAAIPALAVNAPALGTDNRADAANALAALRSSLKNSVDAANAEIASINVQLSGAIPKARSANPALDTAKAELARLQAAKAAADVAANAANVNAVNHQDFNVAASALVTKQAELLAAQALYDDAKRRLEDETSNLPGIAFLDAGQTFTHRFTIWIGNESITSDDADFDVGKSGQVIRPVKGAVNTVRWNDSYGVVASVRFTADSDASFFLPRLSTRWSSIDYANAFADQDAYLFDFVGNPTLPATSRAELQLRNPFVDEDGHATVKPRSIVIYQVDKGSLTDVTRLFDSTVSDDGDRVFSTRTRTLGTYIICEKEVELEDDSHSGGNKKPSASDPVIPAVDMNSNGKPVPNTGR